MDSDNQEATNCADDWEYRTHSDVCDKFYIDVIPLI